MEIQNLLNSVFNNNTEVSNDLLSRINVGDILKAKVLSMIGDTIMLEINDKFTLEAKDVSSIHYNVGDLIEFTVADMSDDKLTIKSNISKLALFESKLSEMGVKLDDENKELVKLLFKNQIPITKENLSTILSTKNYYGKLTELIKENNLTISPETFNNDIKVALKNIIQTNEFNLEDKSSIQGDKAITTENQKGLNNNLPFIKELLNGENKPTLEKLVFMLKNNLNFNLKDIVLVDNIVSGNKTITDQLENLIKHLDSGELDKDSPMLKKNLDFNLKDTQLVDNKVSVNKAEITDKLRDIMKHFESGELDKHSPIKDETNVERKIENVKLKAKLLNILEKLDTSNIKENDKLKSVMKELFQSLDDIKNSTVNNENRTVINRQINEIKTSFDFVNRLNENMTFIQIPININNSQKNLDIYINKDGKSSKKINPQNAKIFISLNTNNLDLVQVLIELNKKDVNLNFKISDQKIKKIIKDNEMLLENKLKECDFNNIIFKYSINDEKTDLTTLDFSEKKSKINTLDIRV